MAKPEQFYALTMGTGLQTILLVNNGLHIEIQIDREHPIGKQNPAGVKDVVLEAAVTTICDCEDSVTAVDGADKTLTFRNWLGLMQGNLEAEFIKAGKTVNRTLNPDREFTSVGGVSITLPGRRVMLIRNVGHLMTPNAVLLDGEEIPEGLLDTMITAYIALHQLHGVVKYAKSSTGSIYIVHELITVLSSRLPETSIPCFI